MKATGVATAITGAAVVAASHVNVGGALLAFGGFATAAGERSGALPLSDLIRSRVYDDNGVGTAQRDDQTACCLPQASAANRIYSLDRVLRPLADIFGDILDT